MVPFRQLYTPLTWLGTIYRMTEDSLVDMERMFKLLHLQPEVQDQVWPSPLAPRPLLSSPPSSRPSLPPLCHALTVQWHYLFRHHNHEDYLPAGPLPLQPDAQSLNVTKGAIEFDGVSFSYDGGVTPVLR